MRIQQEGTQFVLVMDDGGKQLIPEPPVNFNVIVQAALPDQNGLIVGVGLALGIARAECAYWKALAERRGEELANIRENDG